MTELTYGATVATEDLTVYIVQTTYPGYRDGELKPDRFGQFIITAYTSADYPGARRYFHLDMRFKHLFANPQRADYTTLGIHKFNHSIVFMTAEAAFAAAAALETRAVLASPFEGSEEWRTKERGMPLKARVVEHRLAMIDRVVLR